MNHNKSINKLMDRFWIGALAVIAAEVAVLVVYVAVQIAWGILALARYG